MLAARARGLSGVGGEQRESLPVQRREGSEVPLVEAHDAIGPVAIGQHDECAMGKSELEVFVADFESDDGGVVLALQARDSEASGSEIAEEGAPCSMPEAAAEQVVDLRRGRGGDNERSGFATTTGAEERSSSPFRPSAR